MSQKSTLSERDKLANELLTDEDLMVIFKVSKSTIRRWVKKGILKAVPFGATKYYSLTQLKKTINEKSHPFYKRKGSLKALNS